MICQFQYSSTLKRVIHVPSIFMTVLPVAPKSHLETHEQRNTQSLQVHIIILASSVFANSVSVLILQNAKFIFDFSFMENISAVRKLFTLSLSFNI